MDPSSEQQIALRIVLRDPVAIAYGEAQSSQNHGSGFETTACGRTGNSSVPCSLSVLGVPDGGLSVGGPTCLTGWPAGHGRLEGTLWPPSPRIPEPGGGHCQQESPLSRRPRVPLAPAPASCGSGGETILLQRPYSTRSPSEEKTRLPPRSTSPHGARELLQGYCCDRQSGKSPLSVTLRTTVRPLQARRSSGVGVDTQPGTQARSQIQLSRHTLSDP